MEESFAGEILWQHGAPDESRTANQDGINITTRSIKC